MALQTVVIHDPNSGSRAEIAPGLGFNCFRFQAMVSGSPRDVLWSHPDFLGGQQRPSGSGIPLLFPFAGRIQAAVLHYQQRDYPLEPGDPMGNAIHGFVLNRPWRVVEQSESRVVGQFQASLDDPSLLGRWPADFRITASYEVQGSTLSSLLTVDNPASVPLPFSLATHAYFRLPVGGQAGPEETVVAVPVSDQWELADLRPTGKRLGLGALADLPGGLALAGRPFDNVFGLLGSEGGRYTTKLRSGDDRRTLTQSFDDSFRHVVVYTPPHREAICMEPYTALPDPFRMEAQGIESGLRLLPPGQSHQAWIEIRLE